ncbi:MAG: dihydroneopterin aldolase [Bacteroidales bacterium]|nr:dihydroneopterin aldolase [Bacteroidales bacterium]
MARIAINDMRFYAHHGCFEQERSIGTHFRVDLCFEVDTSRAELSDNIDDTVSYLDVYQVVKREMMQPSNLLENVARRVGEAVLREFSDTMTVMVRVYKLNPPLGGQMDSVSVELTLAR